MEIQERLNELNFEEAFEICGLICFSFRDGTTVKTIRDEMKDECITFRELAAEIDKLQPLEQLQVVVSLCTKKIDPLELKFLAND
ncbi:MAG: hypothetical protein HEQ19_13915 [Gloeotrichia echinulata CP02]|jgi:hypothetical protein|nr:hypothetical protein [Gloeotrichia echinulata DEX184]